MSNGCFATQISFFAPAIMILECAHESGVSTVGMRLEKCTTEHPKTHLPRAHDDDHPSVLYLYPNMPSHRHQGWTQCVLNHAEVPKRYHRWTELSMTVTENLPANYQETEKRTCTRNHCKGSCFRVDDLCVCHRWCRFSVRFISLLSLQFILRINFKYTERRSLYSVV